MADPDATPAGRLIDTAAPAVDAATVLLVRDAPSGGVEVLLLERHLDSDFAGGALVFPGGKVDDRDRTLGPDRLLVHGLTDWVATTGVGSEPEALGLLVAAVRETFEEVGVLFARRADGSVITAADLARPAFRDARARLASRDERWDWRPWLIEHELILDLDALALWSWWVTPEGQHKRFDTRFFIARAPTDQVATHDDVEATSAMWMRPNAALEAQARDEVTIIFPTRRNLADLARFTDAASAWRAARDGRVDQRRIEPAVVRVAGRVMLQHPFEDEPSTI